MGKDGLRRIAFFLLVALMFYVAAAGAGPA